MVHLDLRISFADADKFKALDGPLYITTRITKYASFGCLVDPTSMVNFIIEEHIYNKRKHHDFCDKVPLFFLLSNVVKC